MVGDVVEQIKYYENGNIALVDGYKFRKDKKTGYYLSSKFINNKRKRLHIYMWEKYNGNVPKGYQVHHIDRNKGNNDIENLKLLSIKEHLSLHASEQDIEMLRNRIKEASSKANEWHKSETGKQWHKKHYQEMKDKLNNKIQLQCLYCGKDFISKNTGKNKFCSNNCKSQYRKQGKVDNVFRICLYCGKEFEVNKYAKRKYCSSKCSYKAVPRGGWSHINKKN